MKHNKLTTAQLYFVIGGISYLQEDNESFKLPILYLSWRNIHWTDRTTETTQIQIWEFLILNLVVVLRMVLKPFVKRLSYKLNNPNFALMLVLCSYRHFILSLKFALIVNLLHLSSIFLLNKNKQINNLLV